MTGTGHSGAAAKNWVARTRSGVLARVPAGGWPPCWRLFCPALIFLVRELQSDFTSSGTLCRGWLYLPEV
jgi:hypothetical protein